MTNDRPLGTLTFRIPASVIFQALVEYDAIPAIADFERARTMALTVTAAVVPYHQGRTIELTVQQEAQ